MAPHTAGLQSADLLTGGAMCDMLMPAIAAHLLPRMILLILHIDGLAAMSQFTVSGPPVATQTAEQSTKYMFRAPVCRVNTCNVADHDLIRQLVSSVCKEQHCFSGADVTHVRDVRIVAHVCTYMYMHVD